jgi:hypothetical protein
MSNIDGYELTLAEAIIMAHRAQDIHANLRIELSKLQNGGHSMLGPAGRMGFTNLVEVLKYLVDIEKSIEETKRAIAEYDSRKLAEYGSGTIASQIKATMKRIEAAKGST